MSDGVRETQCTSCIHRTMCKYRDIYLHALEQVLKMEIGFDEDSKKLVPISELEFLNPIELDCKYQQTLDSINAISYRTTTVATN